MRNVFVDYYKNMAKNIFLPAINNGLSDKDKKERVKNYLENQKLKLSFDLLLMIFHCNLIHALITHKATFLIKLSLLSPILANPITAAVLLAVSFSSVLSWSAFLIGFVFDNFGAKLSKKDNILLKGLGYTLRAIGICIEIPSSLAYFVTKQLNDVIFVAAAITTGIALAALGLVFAAPAFLAKKCLGENNFISKGLKSVSNFFLSATRFLKNRVNYTIEYCPLMMLAGYCKTVFKSESGSHQPYKQDEENLPQQHDNSPLGGGNLTTKPSQSSQSPNVAPLFLLPYSQKPCRSREELWGISDSSSSSSSSRQPSPHPSHNGGPSAARRNSPGK